MTIPLRTFVMRQPPAAVGTSCWTNGAKHQKMFHDPVRKRNVVFGGDYTNASAGGSACNEVWSYDPVADVVGGAATRGFTLLSPYCHGPGNITPCRPDDGQPCGYDAKLDRYWVIPGGWRSDNDGTVCNVGTNPGSTYYHGLMWMNPASGVWTAVTKSLNILGAHQGQFDPVRRCLIGLDVQPLIHRVFVDAPSHDATPLRTGVTFSGGTGDRVGGNAVAENDWAIDVIGRWAYAIYPYERWAGNVYRHSLYKFIRFNLDNPSIQQELASPPFNYPANAIAGSGSIRPVFDTRNRKVIWYYQRSICGTVHGVGVYDPSTDKWQTFPVLTSPSSVPTNHIIGNCIAYDSSNNVVILGGGSFCGVPGADPAGEEINPPVLYYSLWRYA